MGQPKIIFILLWTLSHVGAHLYAQTHNIKYLSPTQSALGSNTTVIKGINGISGNPAALYIPSIDFAINAMTEQRFFLSSLNSTSISVMKSLGEYDNLGINIGSFGINEFNEMKFSLTYSRLLTDTWTIGSSSSYYRFRIDEYGTQNDFEIALGTLIKLSKEITLGGAVFNILPDASKGYLRNDTEFALGIDYRLSNKLAWLIDIKSDAKDYLYFSSGIEYELLEKFNFMVGINSLDKGISIGFMYNIAQGWQVNASNRSTQNLGLSPGFSVTYSK